MPRHLLPTALAVLLGLATSALLPPPASAAGPGPERTLSAVHFPDRAALDFLGGNFDVWEVHPDAGYAVVRLTAAERERIVARGMEVVPLVELWGAPAAKLDSRYVYYDDFVGNGRSRYLTDLLLQAARARPDLTELVDLGDAWEKTRGGYPREIAALRISNEDPAFGPVEEKPKFVLMATIHAREVATPELTIRYALHLLRGFRGAGGYGQDPDATWLVDHHAVYLLIMQNPDGHAVNEADTGAYRRKNTDDDDGCFSDSLAGVDLNRNSSFLWGCCNGSSGDPCSETYRGPSRASEPETAAFEAWFADLMGDWNGPNGDDEIPAKAPADTEGVFLSLHSYGDLVLWPWQMVGIEPPPNAAELEKIGRKLAYFNGYDAAGDIGYAVDGATDDWTYGKLGIPGFTFEVGSGGFGECAGFFPDYGCIDGQAGRDFWAENGPAFLYLHKIASRPYVAAFGPDAVGPAVAAPVPAGAPAALTATIEDRRLGGDPKGDVVAAEAFVDAPGPEGSGTPLVPVDGAWDGTAEAVEGSLDTSGLAPGTHYVLVRGQAAGGAWGPFTGAFLEIVE